MWWKTDKWHWFLTVSMSAHDYRMHAVDSVFVHTDKLVFLKTEVTEEQWCRDTKCTPCMHIFQERGLEWLWECHHPSSGWPLWLHGLPSKGISNRNNSWNWSIAYYTSDTTLKTLYIYWLHLTLPTQRRQWQPTPVLLPGKSHGRGAW